MNILMTSPREPTIYTDGGSVQAGNGLYIVRKADQDLLELCRKGAFVYILTARQMGKSSLVIRASQELIDEGIRSVYIDLQKIGGDGDVTAEQWFLGFLVVIRSRLKLDASVLQWWQSHAHLTMTQRLTDFFEEVVLTKVNDRVVIFVDEIDTTLKLDFTDDFFAAIRYLYQARAQTTELERLSFVLIGVATPGDLIRNPQRTPFNIGTPLDLTDFTFDEARPLAGGLGLAPEQAQRVLRHSLAWTGGHPYLTQVLCRALAEQRKSDWSESQIDDVVAATFLGGKSDKNHNLQFVRNMLTKGTQSIEETLTVYREIRRGRSLVRDDERSLVKTHLKLSGVIRREKTYLVVRNRIYATVFDARWIKEHLPTQWTIQRVKQLRRVALAMIVLLVIVIPLAIYATNRAVEAERQKVEAETQKAEAETQRKRAELALSDAEAERVNLERANEILLQQRRRLEESTIQLGMLAQREKGAKQEADQRRQEASEARRAAELSLKQTQAQLLELERLREIADKARQEIDLQRRRAEAGAKRD
jgi:hypothetical protein